MPTILKQPSTRMSEGALVICSYLILFAALLLKGIHGIGQYWDWAFPFYKDDLGNYFARHADSWTTIQNGSPLSYSSDYFARFVISRLQFLQPEWTLYLLLVCLFSAGAFGVYLIARKHMSALVAFVLGAATLINPAIFYKYTAGHIDYLISFVLFIYIIYFLLYKYEKNIRSAVTVGLLLGFAGTQIQFLIIVPLFLIIYFLLNRGKWSWKHASLIAVMAILLNLVWISNFLTGANSVSAISTTASSASFSASSSTSFLNIFDLSFSSATLIAYFFSSLDLVIFLLLFVMILWLISQRKKWDNGDIVLLVFLIFVIFMGTGLYQAVNLGPVTMLYPLLREVGHFAPLIVLTAILLLARLRPQRKLLVSLMAVTLIFSIAISWAKFQEFPQAVNFGYMRSQLSSFETFSKTHQSSEARILAYPFFSQYSIKQFGVPPESGLPLQNTGLDSFSSFAPGVYTNTHIPPQGFKGSVEYKLLTTKDVSVLRPYNIRYIYDLSGIYESNYDRYVPSSTYDNDLSLIKNNPDFLKELAAANPGRVKFINSHILQITDYTPHLAATGNLYSLASYTDANEPMNSFVTQTLASPFVYVDDAAVQPYQTLLTHLFNNLGSKSALDTKSQTISQTFASSANRTSTLYVGQGVPDAFYTLQNNQISVYTKPTGELTANGKLISTVSVAPRALFTKQLDPGKSYFIALNNTTTPVQPGTNVKIGPINNNDTIELLTRNGSNMVLNPSFENGPWQKTVGDCNDYDNNPQLSMSLDAQDKTDGRQSLQITATRHNACTSTSFKLQGNTKYILSYDYQSPSNSIASFYVAYNNSSESPLRATQYVNDGSWHKTNYLFKTPSNAQSGRLFIYALESDQKQENIVRYDNFSLIPAQTIASATTPSNAASYVKQTLPANTSTTFSFTDHDYDYHNLIRNGSFENGLWRSNVADCANYDTNPEIAMKLSSQATDGKHSLQLSATRHNACTYTNVNVSGGNNYLLSFDYQGVGTNQYGYDLNFNDPKASSDFRKLTASGNTWHTLTTEIEAPKDATTLSLYLYAFESDGRTRNIVHYDNVKLVALPNMSNSYFVTSTPTIQLQKPQNVNYHYVSITKNTAQINHASKPFILTMSESYNPKWHLMLDPPQARFTSWLPWAHANNVSNDDHFKFSDYGNAWYVDPAQLCKESQNSCAKNSDGTYNLQLVAEFTPQRWFNLSRGVSVMTIVGSIGYLSYCYFKYRRRPVAGEHYVSRR